MASGTAASPPPGGRQLFDLRRCRHRCAILGSSSSAAVSLSRARGDRRRPRDRPAAGGPRRPVAPARRPATGRAALMVARPLDRDGAEQEADRLRLGAEAAGMARGQDREDLLDHVLRGGRVRQQAARQHPHALVPAINARARPSSSPWRRASTSAASSSRWAGDTEARSRAMGRDPHHSSDVVPEPQAGHGTSWRPRLTPAAPRRRPGGIDSLWSI